MADKEKLEKIAKLTRYFILVSTTEAGSGHPTSSLSATDLMTCLMFSGIFRFNTEQPEHPNNDRIIFSKGMPRRCFMHCGQQEEKLLKRNCCP